ncbi:uncharacterized protein [Epargyreus clarus]|uniref:uncharacterized protein n=1 Tax=Epargyreus clarus TaxID=520877 RepID=UPI003C2B254B
MQRSDRWLDESEEEIRSRPSSRRNSGSLSRRGSVKKEPEVKKTSSSATSTPKRVPKPPNLDFVVTGKQIAKRSDRTNSLPGAYHRRPSADSILKTKRFELPKKATQSSKSRDASIEDDMSLDLSQVSDFEDTNSKYGIQHKFAPLATSSPKRPCQKPRSCSLQNQVLQKEAKKSQRSLDSSKSRQSTFSFSRDSYKTSSSPYRPGTGASAELDYSSVSPEYSAPSSGESAPEAPPDNLVSPRSQDFLDSSFCVSWQDCSEPGSRDGEWSHFWANYNNSLARVPVSRYYDQCPTPYRTEDFDLADLEFSTDGSRKRSPENINTINNIIRNEGLHLTARETQNIIKCAHILGNVLTKAIERRTKDDVPEKIHEIDPEKEIKKKSMSLDLKDTVLPVEVKEEKKWETVMTQTDISLPNTKSAPKIFEKILRQLSKTSLEVPEKIEKVDPEKDKEKKEVKETKEVKEELKEVVNGT